MQVNEFTLSMLSLTCSDSEAIQELQAEYNGNINEFLNKEI